ncbi:flocculation protein FLO11 [Amborella trichopoda]|uniref:Uncharacterized protein n=1 Tax=Amborella trichopoda TaxID=13333 RepID=W1PB53_AMBTC|nr:flocculation protein FLO11 [Amborella trichopoda]XP_011622691.1 flocculation protein FLO11 [Amborella trichopoda]XP_011622692.1 flocculation protein FLO11 [Amborella trichopoda]ERN04240.1 hypothetical protein AMTR_s00077p00146340 [Amborella trichopoda]|eukprot:XP_006842565.1 flocculation protein FLO11 [Amborella trichopoda]
MNHHRRGHSLTGISGIPKEKDENLQLFHSNHRSMFIPSSDESESPINSARLGRIAVASAKPRTGMDDLLNTEYGKHDYDWLLTPPGTPLFSTTDSCEFQRVAVAPKGVSSVRSASATKASRLSVTQTESTNPRRAVRSSSVSRPSLSSPNHSFSNSNSKNFLNTSTQSITSRPSTPVPRNPTPSRAATPTRTRPSPTPSKPTTPRPSTPTSRATIPASKSSLPATKSNSPAAKSSFPAIKSHFPATTPAAKPSFPATSRPSQPSPPAPLRSRPTTPTRRILATVTPPPAGPPRAASVGRTRGVSPQRHVAPIVPPDFPMDAPPNLRTTLPERPASAGRMRPGVALTARLGGNGPSEERQPSRVRPSSNGNGSGSEVVGIQKSQGGVARPPGGGASPVRRPVKPAGSTGESTGFGRNISKKSLDMALRHMDIRQATGGLRPLSATSLFPQSVRSVSSKARLGGLDPRASKTSNGTLGHAEKSSESSPEAKAMEGPTIDAKLNGRLMDPDFSASTRYDAILLKEDTKNTEWLHSPNGDNDPGLVFDHRFEPLPEPFGLP